ncbi:hypothetical protein D3273_23385 [Lichenibacterium minor]|uniref:Uncharacterized protein n=1 Tax=Lichenibacterium minor TaxID=2316528 RepID=A0A4Q2TZH6_9HYPH|nr:hypothetical protein [Lichenibacterium minor]RYC29533.1 hypothetical protein D3273_23385 [Lichenibacterium minor]
MTDTTTATPENVALVDHADRILEVLRHRDPTEADAQACSMFIASLRMLEEVRGVEAVAALLGKVGPIMAGHFPGGPVVAAPAVPPEPVALPPSPSPTPSHADLVANGIAYLRNLPLGAAMAEANAAMEIGGTFLHQAFGELAKPDAEACDVVEARPAPKASRAPQPAPVTPDPDALAVTLLDNLRGTAPDRAHEEARAAIVGAAAYLIEARGPAYTAAVVDGLLINARRHIEVWGASPRPDGTSLH